MHLQGERATYWGLHQKGVLSGVECESILLQNVKLSSSSPPVHLPSTSRPPPVHLQGERATYWGLHQKGVLSGVECESILLQNVKLSSSSPPVHLLCTSRAPPGRTRHLVGTAPKRCSVGRSISLIPETVFKLCVLTLQVGRSISLIPETVVKRPLP